MQLRTLARIFDWFTTAELLLARLVIFALFLIGLWTVFQWGRGHHAGSHGQDTDARIHQSAR